MNRWPDFNHTAVLQDSTKSIDEYIKKLESEISALKNELECTKDEAKRMQMERNAAVKELSVYTGKYAQLEENDGIFRAIEASRELFTAFETAEFVMNEVRNIGSVRAGGQSQNLKIQEMEKNLQAALENTGFITSQLKDAQKENEKLRGEIANLQTDLEILQSVNIRFRNIFRDFAQKAQFNFHDTDQIIASISGSPPPSLASFSQSSILGSLDEKDGTQGDFFGFEDAVNVSVDLGANQTCGLTEDEDFPEAFYDAVGTITSEEMAELEKAFAMI